MSPPATELQSVSEHYHLICRGWKPTMIINKYYQHHLKNKVETISNKAWNKKLMKISTEIYI